MAGHAYAGHTEIFGEFTHGDNYAMLLWSKQLKAIHVSTHISLRDACTSLTKERIVNVIHLAHQTLKKQAMRPLGLRWRDSIPQEKTACLAMRRSKKSSCGGEFAKSRAWMSPAPLPRYGVSADIQGEFDIEWPISRSGHIPLKLLAFDEGVNITVGLDVVRTSVDHGTAFDIAGKLLAKPDSLLYAISGEKL